MKIQINAGNGNKQESSDPNTTQIQIGSKEIKMCILALLVVVGLVVYLIVRR